MNHLSDLEPPKAAVTFHGCEHDTHAHIDVVRAILKTYCQDPHATVKVYANTGPEHYPLEWTLRHSSPRGIITLSVVQRLKCGAIRFSEE